MMELCSSFSVVNFIEGCILDGNTYIQYICVCVKIVPIYFKCEFDLSLISKRCKVTQRDEAGHAMHE
jgi:hypothetical protein